MIGQDEQNAGSPATHKNKLYHNRSPGWNLGRVKAPAVQA